MEALRIDPLLQRFCVVFINPFTASLFVRVIYDVVCHDKSHFRGSNDDKTFLATAAIAERPFLKSLMTRSHDVTV